MEISLEMVLDAIGMTADDARIDEESGEVYVPLSKTLALWLKDDEDEGGVPVADETEGYCGSRTCGVAGDKTLVPDPEDWSDYDISECCCDDDCDCDDDYDCDKDDFCVPNLVELAQTYGVEILVNERNRAKELGQQEAFDALNFAVDVLLHQNALDTEWLADTYDNVVE